MSITSFDETNANAFAKEAVAALEALAKKHGVDIKRGGGRFDAMTLDMKLKVTVKRGCVAFDRKRVALVKRAKKYGFISLINQEFEFGGSQYRLVGYNPRGKKYNWIIEDVRDGRYNKASTEDLAGVGCLAGLR